MTTKKILLIESHPSDASLMKYAISGLSISCELWVVDGRTDAMRFLKQNGRPTVTGNPVLPDLIILGLEDSKDELLKLLKWVRTNHRTHNIPVVVLTSNAEDQEMQAVYRLGANSYIEKPLDFARFQHLLTNIGNYWLKINRPTNRISADEKYQTHSTY